MKYKLDKSEDDVILVLGAFGMFLLGIAVAVDNMVAAVVGAALATTSVITWWHISQLRWCKRCECFATLENPAQRFRLRHHYTCPQCKHHDRE